LETILTQPSYKHAPITEAVIEIKIDSSLDQAEIERASAKFLTHYPQDQRIESVKVALLLATKTGSNPKTKVDRDVGHRRSSLDLTELLVLFPSSLMVSQLAPYPGWDQFYRRFCRDWRIWKKAVGFKTISRIGVRYINRIDIPMLYRHVEHETYLNVYPRLPDIIGQVGGYAVQAVSWFEDIGCKLALNSAVVPAPILDHASFIVDQDIIREIDPPQSEKAIFQLLNQIRTKKNAVFEACVTDRARKLFQS
jgi:uncharacterized protein (TIGR04255 family)